jgi:hypothetical protein
MNYRRKWGTQIWHSSPDCPNWPQSELEAEERAEKPASGDFCPDCQDTDQGTDGAASAVRD